MTSRYRWFQVALVCGVTLMAGCASSGQQVQEAGVLQDSRPVSKAELRRAARTACNELGRVWVSVDGDGQCVSQREARDVLRRVSPSST